MKNLQIMDCTLRDGANVVGLGFSPEMTKMMIEGLIASKIRIIEFGNAYGAASGAKAPCTDEEYLKLMQPYVGKAELGMFLGYKNANEEFLEMAKKYSLNFLRVGNNAGDGKNSCEAVKMVKKHGLKCFYSLMKGYIVSAEKLAEETKMLADCGIDEVTIMDSAGTMTPDEVEKYTAALVKAVNIPVAFHGHNNIGLATANAIAAAKGGARILDCGLMGMARSAGNCATEIAVAVFQRMGCLADVDFYKLLDFIDNELAPAMEAYHYKAPVVPLDLVYGLSGCHSSFAELFKSVAKEKNVPLYKLIIEVSAIDKKAPGKELMEKVAAGL